MVVIPSHNLIARVGVSGSFHSPEQPVKGSRRVHTNLLRRTILSVERLNEMSICKVNEHGASVPLQIA